MIRPPVAAQEDPAAQVAARAAAPVDQVATLAVDQVAALAVDQVAARAVDQVDRVAARAVDQVARRHPAPAAGPRSRSFVRRCCVNRSARSRTTSTAVVRVSTATSPTGTERPTSAPMATPGTDNWS